jgi:PAS domain S-box-containing protein
MFGEIFERAKEAYLVLDNHLEVVCCNRAASKLLRATIDTQNPILAEQSKLHTALANASCAGEWLPLQITLSGAESSHTFEARLRRLRDEPALHRYIVILDKGNAKRDAFKTLRDEVVRAHARSATLEAAKKRLANVIEATQAGCWEWDLKSSRIWVNEYWRHMLGLEDDEFECSIKQWKQLCHPDDIARAREHIKAHFRGDARPHDFEVRLRHKKGHWIWVSDNSRVVERDENGRPVTMAGTHIDITQRKTHARELDEKRLEAEAANIAKSQFLAIMSHEIRTPMNGVLGMLDVVNNSQLTTEQRDHVEIARTSAHMLLRVLNDILDFSKLEAGAVDFECVPYSPCQVIDQVAELLRPKAEENRLKLVISKNEGIPDLISGDATRLRQVLMNLVGNAIKFTESGSIEISAAIENGRDLDRLMITVRDTGIGIADEVQPKLFNHFAQADSSMTRRFGGTGLGLAICKQLVELMGGEIGVQSKEGKGSVFWFALPVREPNNCSSKGCIKSDAETSIEVICSTPSMRILAADDHPVNQQVLKCFLAAAGHEAVIVGNGREALQALDDNSFDAILMDIEMPVMDGIAATRAIRSRSGPDRHTPIIAVTANALAGDRERYLSIGMDEYVSKPFDLQNLQAALARVSNNRLTRKTHNGAGISQTAPAKASTG